MSVCRLVGRSVGQLVGLSYFQVSVSMLLSEHLLKTILACIVISKFLGDRLMYEWYDGPVYGRNAATLYCVCVFLCLSHSLPLSLSLKFFTRQLILTDRPTDQPWT